MGAHAALRMAQRHDIAAAAQRLDAALRAAAARRRPRAA